jgi:ATP-dependent RNA helicase DeaD
MNTDRMSYSRPDSGSHEPGMVRICMNMGKAQGMRVNDVVGVIAYHASIPGHMIGKIYIQEDRSLVDVPEQFAPQVLAKSGEIHFRRQPLELQRA